MGRQTGWRAAAPAGFMPRHSQRYTPDADALYPLTQGETEILRQLENHLVRHLDRDSDPKFDRACQVLAERFEGRSWLERGV